MRARQYLRDLWRAVIGQAEARRQEIYSAGFEQALFDARMDIATGRAKCPCRGEIYPDGAR